MSSSGKKYSYFMQSPPPMFTYLDNKLSCCFGPLSRGSLSFLKTIGVDKIINLSGKKLDLALLELCTSTSLAVSDVNINDQDFPRSSLPKFTEWLTIQVTEILTAVQTQSVVIFGSLDNHISSLVIACIRRHSDWSILSIIAEFRQFTWPYRMRDYEQLIESYRPTVIETLVFEPQVDSKQTFDNENEESRNELESSSIGEQVSEVYTHPINEVLRALFLSTPHTKLVSDGVRFDASISLVNDKDDDD